MIERITAPSKLGKSVQVTPKNRNNTVNYAQNSISGCSNFSVPAENVKANFMPLKEKISFTGQYDELETLKCTSGVKPSVDMSKFLPKDFYKGYYYKKTADDLAAALGPDKNAILSQKETAIPEMMVQDFTRSVFAGKYENLGIYSDTNVKIIDYGKYRKKNPLKALTEIIEGIFNENPAKKNILFIKNYEDLLVDGKSHVNIADKIAKDDSAIGKADTKEVAKATVNGTADIPAAFNDFLTDRELLYKNNVQIVGIMPEAVVDALSDPKMMTKELYGIKQATQNDMFIPLNGISTKQTKELLKKDKQFVDSVFEKYYDNGAEMRIADSAIDRIVDKAAVSINGTFPAKALQIIDLIAADKAIKNQKLIREEDVNNFFASKNALLSSIKSNDQFHAVENVKTKIEDVGGLHKAKDEIKDIVNFLKNPDTYLKTGKEAPKGALFEGGPGTGKTYFASAIAGSCDVPFISVSASSFPSKFVGEGASNVRKAFAKARELAVDSGKNSAVLFIDEIDAVGKKRGTGHDGGESDATLNALLTEMDGLETKDSNVKVVVLAATNRADMLDDALKRPGRFDSLVHFDPPSTKAETREILNVQARKLKFADEQTKENILNEMAERLTDHSGADIQKAVKETQKVIGERIENTFKGKTPPKDAFNTTTNDVMEGYMRTWQGRVNIDNEAKPLQKEITVMHEAGHATIQNFFTPENLDFISNQSRGIALGVTFIKSPKENPKFKDIIKDISCDYAGFGAEKVFIHDGDAGWSMDLKSAANKINSSIEKWGLGINAPKMNLEDPETKAIYKDEIKKDINIFEKTSRYVSDKILDFHKDFLTGPYMEKFRAESKSGMGGNVLSGTEFNNMVKTWVKENGKEKELMKLHEHIDKVIGMAQKGDLSFLHKSFAIFRALHLDRLRA